MNRWSFARMSRLLAFVAALLIAPAFYAADAQPNPQELAAKAGDLMKKKEWAGAADLLEQLTKLNADDEQHWYNLACARAMRGDSAKALAALTGALEHGWTDFKHLESDEDLASLRKLPEYTKLLEQKDEMQRKRTTAGLEKLKKKYGDSMSHYEVDPDLKMVFATSLDDRSHKEVKEFVGAHAKAMQRDLFAHPIERYLTVVIPKKWANPKVTGHFYPPAYVDAATMGSNLRHEFTHALHFADQQGRGQEHPVWIMEGLAVLYQDSRIVDGFAIPQVTYRVMELQQEVSNKKIYAFPVMMKLKHRAFTSHHYAQAGSMLMYLYQKGLLKKFYTAFTEGYQDDPTGIVACEKVCEKKIEDVQKDWVDWLLKLPPPLPLPGANRPALGLGFKQQADGLLIDQIAPGGAAETAQLKAGDVLVRLGGERIVDDEDLIRVVFSSKIGDTLPLQYRRGDQYVDTKITIAGSAETQPEK